jgi:membrane fusion protein, multidrug efflux system
MVPKRLKSGDKLQVEAYDRDQKTKLATGTLITVDNQIDTTTGTVKLKAQFDNQDGSLFANQFVNARMLVDTLREATIIPSAAIQRGAQGIFVYVVNTEDQTVSVRPVRLGPTEGNDTAVERGLKPGQLVVVDGTDRLREGAKVELANAEARKAAATPGDGGRKKGKRKKGGEKSGE